MMDAQDLKARLADAMGEGPPFRQDVYGVLARGRRRQRRLTVVSLGSAVTGVVAVIAAGVLVVNDTRHDTQSTRTIDAANSSGAQATAASPSAPGTAGPGVSGTAAGPTWRSDLSAQAVRSRITQAAEQYGVTARLAELPASPVAGALVRLAAELSGAVTGRLYLVVTSGVVVTSGATPSDPCAQDVASCAQWKLSDQSTAYTFTREVAGQGASRILLLVDGSGRRLEETLSPAQADVTADSVLVAIAEAVRH